MSHFETCSQHKSNKEVNQSKVSTTVQLQELIDELDGALLPDNRRLRGDANRWISYIQARLKEIKNDSTLPVQAKNPDQTNGD